MFRRAIPVLHVRSSTAAEQYFCNGLGFNRRFAYRPDQPKPDPCYMGLERDGVIFHISSFPGDGVLGGIAIVNRDIAVDIPQPNLGFVSPIYFNHVLIRASISSLGMVRPSSESFSPRSIIR